MPPPSGARRWLIAAAVLWAIHQLGVAMTAPLLTHAPLVLIAMSPLGRNLLLAAPITAPVPFVLVAAARRAVGSAVGYHIGRAYGQRALLGLDRRAPRLARFARGFERLFARWDGPMAFLVPRGSAVVAGAADMGFLRYMVLSTAGHAFWAAVTYQVGDWLSGYIEPVLAFIQSHVREVTLGFVLLVMVQMIYHRLRRRSTDPA